MELLAELMKVILTISNSLLYPVMILLVMLTALSFMFVGQLLSEYSKRSRNLDRKFNGGHLSIFYEDVNKLLAKHRDNEKMLTIKIERLLQEYETGIMKKLEKTRLLIRIGPVLGLMGTLIPLGPALLGLGTGKIEQLANNLVIAFTSTVVGLLIGSVSMVVTAIRQRWHIEDRDDMEYMVEMLMEKRDEDEQKNGIYA
ncbi:MAG: MotA/TolQ/ExbB proton channel family protein [Candidatus Altiarchaeota archaeon]|nr:MotA/TolQ/ExbB proton channel family protein [Candidatus Altiarchaeota archaeon]